MRCPNCGASLTVDDGATSVACQYCGTTSRIQTRSRVLQVPRPLPTGGPQPGGPVARQRVNRAVLIGPAVFTAGVIGFSGYMAQRSTERVQRAISQQVPVSAGTNSTPAPPEQRPDTWATGLPLVADVDGDGGDDLIGLTRNVMDGDRAQIGAFSGATGTPLWRGERLGTYSDTVQAVLYLAGDHVLMATPGGELRSFGTRDGAPRWTTAMGERIDAACAIGGEAERVMVGTSDRRWHVITLVDGARRDAAEPKRVGGRDRKITPMAWVQGTLAADTCLPLPSSGREAMPGLTTADSWAKGLPSVDGMSLARVVRRGDGPVVAIGGKTPGTAVPMLAVLDGKRVRWSAAVPSSDPLQARAEDEHVTVSGDAVFQVWQDKDGPRLAAFDLADGRRRWDVALDKDQARVVVGAMIVGGRVLVAGWGGLQAFDAADGKPVYSLGS